MRRVTHAGPVDRSEFYEPGSVRGLGGAGCAGVSFDGEGIDDGGVWAFE
jgi:hypothetical protein